MATLSDTSKPNPSTALHMLAEGPMHQVTRGRLLLLGISAAAGSGEKVEIIVGKQI